MKARGFTLIETLVAIVVLSVGLLGAVNMLLGSLRSQNDSRREVVALALLRDAADRLSAGELACASAACVANSIAEERAVFAASTARSFPGGDAISSLEYVPVTGAAPGRYLLTLRLARGLGMEILDLRVSARAPVAG